MTCFAALRDPALRLAVVDTLRRARKVDLRAVPGATSQDRINTRTLHALLRAEVPDDALARITTLEWEGGGHKIQHLVWPLWHGEDDTFYVHSLAGIDALRSLRELTLATDAELQPLLQLDRLRSARLLLAGGQALAGAATLRALRDRGVSLTVEDMGSTPRATRRLTLPRGA